MCCRAIDQTDNIQSIMSKFVGGIYVADMSHLIGVYYHGIILSYINMMNESWRGHRSQLG